MQGTCFVVVDVRKPGCGSREAGREAQVQVTREDARAGAADVAVQAERPFEEHAAENVPIVGDWLAGKLYGSARNAVPDGAERDGTGSASRKDAPDWGEQSP